MIAFSHLIFRYTIEKERVMPTVDPNSVMLTGKWLQAYKR